MTTGVKFPPSGILSVTKLSLQLKGTPGALVWKESSPSLDKQLVSFLPKKSAKSWGEPPSHVPWFFCDGSKIKHSAFFGDSTCQDFPQSNTDAHLLSESLTSSTDSFSRNKKSRSHRGDGTTIPLPLKVLVKLSFFICHRIIC